MCLEIFSQTQEPSLVPCVTVLAILSSRLLIIICVHIQYGCESEIEFAT